MIRASKAKGRKACTESGECGLAPGHKHVGVGSSAVFWWAKLAEEWDSGVCTAAIFIGFSIEILQAAQNSGAKHLPAEFPLCIPRERIPFLDENGESQTQPTHANVIVLLPDGGRMVEQFEREYAEIGNVFNQFEGA